MKSRRLLTLIGALVLIVTACGSDDPAAGETTTTAAAETTTSAAEMMDGIHASDTELGTILVDGEGFTLYVFTADTAGESTCYDACEAAWPPVPADSEIGADLDASLFGSTARTDGSEQLTVNGQPLYRYAPDASPGDTTGQGVNGVWFVVDTSGTMIGGPEASNGSTTTVEDDGLDY